MLQGKAGEYTRIDKDQDDSGGRGSGTCLNLISKYIKYQVEKRNSAMIIQVASYPKYEEFHTILSIHIH